MAVSGSDRWGDQVPAKVSELIGEDVGSGVRAEGGGDTSFVGRGQQR